MNCNICIKYTKLQLRLRMLSTVKFIACPSYKMQYFLVLNQLHHQHYKNVIKYSFKYIFVNWMEQKSSLKKYWPPPTYSNRLQAFKTQDLETQSRAILFKYWSDNLWRTSTTPIPYISYAVVQLCFYSSFQPSSSIAFDSIVDTSIYKFQKIVSRLQLVCLLGFFCEN